MELSRWSRPLAWLSIFFVASGMALVACGGDADSVEVTGTSTGAQIEDGTMSGPTLPTTGWEATTLRDAVYVYTSEMSDARVSGEQETTVNCDFVEDGETVHGDCWGTLIIENDGGTWDGTFTGTTTFSMDEPAHRHVIDGTYIGTGDYDGLRYTNHVEGRSYPWSITGRIEPAE